MEEQFEFEVYLNEKLSNDEKFLEAFKEIGNKFGYEANKSYRLSLNKIRKPYVNDYARVTLEGMKAKVSTTSSIWNIEEAIIMNKQLQESIELASEINTLFEKVMYSYKQKFKKEQKSI